MSDEPLYCIVCGKEDCSEHMVEVMDASGAWSIELPPDERRYCECCGVIPAPGKHCAFWGKGGNKVGCEP